MVNIAKHHDKMFSELPKEISDKGVKYLKSFLSVDDIQSIKDDFEKDPDTWWASTHFTWGMGIRNNLRQYVCLDDKLPSGNWDDYYVRLVEIACGLK